MGRPWRPRRRRPRHSWPRQVARLATNSLRPLSRALSGEAKFLSSAEIYIRRFGGRHPVSGWAGPGRAGPGRPGRDGEATARSSEQSAGHCSRPSVGRSVGRSASRSAGWLTLPGDELGPRGCHPGRAARGLISFMSPVLSLLPSSSSCSSSSSLSEPASAKKMAPTRV